MCGLTGIARHPHTKGLKVTKKNFSELVRSIESRGRHATGMALVGKKNHMVWKWAQPASKATVSDGWQETLKNADKRYTMYLGHTRFATFLNGHKDEAAHPFVEGKIVGAHNGVISNWDDIAKELGRSEGDDKWIVDSQAIFGLLDNSGNPKEALEALEGYFALSWTQGGKLFLARTTDAPLYCAYSSKYRTLLWNSEKKNLTKLLSDPEITVWPISPDMIYEFDTNKFSGSGTNAVRTEAKFHRPTKKVIMPGEKGWFKKTEKDWKKDDRWNNSSWPTRKEMDTIYKRMKDLEDQVDMLKMENEHMYEIMNQNGLFEIISDDEGVCMVCDKPRTEAKGYLLDTPEGMIHEDCFEGAF